LVNWEGKRNIINGKDALIYSSNARFPKNYICFVKTCQLRDYKLVEIAVRRYKYNPVSGSLKCLVNGTLSVDSCPERKRSALNHAVPLNADIYKKDDGDL